MVTTTPNKETIRRISLLNGASYCYILVDPIHTHVYVLVDIDNRKTNAIKEEFELWCGMKFKVLSNLPETKETTALFENGEKILPIKIG